MRAPNLCVSRLQFALAGAVLVANFAAAANHKAASAGLPTSTVGLAVIGQMPEDESGLTKLERQVLNQIVYRHRQQQSVLRRADSALRAGRTAEGLSYLQHVLDSREDGFLWTGDGPRLVSVRSEAARILNSLRPEAVRTYEGIYGRQARVLLEEALEAGTPAAVDEVARRFFYTEAGYRAADWQASRWLDHGRADLAVRRLRDLSENPVHRRRVTRSFRLKLQFASRLAQLGASPKPADQQSPANAIQQTSAVSPVFTDVKPARWQSDDLKQTASIQVAYGPPKAFDSLLETRATTPYLEPLWTVSFLEDGDRDLFKLASDWQQHQARQLDPPAVANSALIVAGMVISRNFQGIQALHADTGAVVWKHQCQTSLDAMVRRFNKLFGRSTHNPGHVGSQLNFGHAFAGNSTMGTLTTDGQRVYAIDSVDLSYRPPSRHRAADAQSIAHPNVSRNSNQLIALDALPSDAQQPIVWTVGGKPTDGEQDELAGHFFLGPPLPADGRLFAVTEADRQLNLVALDPATGALQWTQGIGFVELPIPEDPTRSSLACSPTYAQGVVICPTQLGILVGVDAVTGSLLWASYYGNAEAMRGFGRWPHTTHRTYGHAGFPNVPQVSGSRMVSLPRHSQNIVCLDVHSGEPMWSAERRDAEYVAAIDNDVVLVVGRQYCRGISLQSGTEIWSTRLTMPSGRGLAARGRYLLPLHEGRIATIEISTGREVGLTRANATPNHSFSDETPASVYDGRQLWTFNEVAAVLEQGPISTALSTTPWVPGNLLAHKDTIISAGIQQIDVFPQSAALLAEVEDELAIESSSIELRLLAAELQLARGDFVGAKFRLAGILSSASTASQQRRATNLLRDTLYRELEDPQGDEAAILDQLNPLALDSIDRGRYLICRIESQLTRGDLSGLYASLHELADLDVTDPLATLRDPAHLLSPSGWIADVANRLPEHFGQNEIDVLRGQIEMELQLAVAAGDLDELRHMHAAYSAWPESARVREELARKLIERGHFHQGELLLIECRRGDDPRVAASATQQLVDLWTRLGLFQDAARLLQELGEDYRQQRLDDGTTGEQFVAGFPRSSLTWSAYRQLQPVDDPVRRVRISENRWSSAEPHLVASYKGYRRKLQMPPGQVFDLLEKGSARNSTMAIVDKQSGVHVGSINMPSPNQYPSPRRNAHVGHFIPIGSSAALNGVSLLQRGATGPLWSTTPAAPVFVDETLRVGVAGPTFCTFQSRQQFVVADPKSGHILWQRNDLQPNCGLLASVSYGLFGDDEVLVMFAPDKSSYTVYRTATGRVHSRGRLEIYSRHQPHTFGRRLFYLTQTEAGRRCRIWDPLDGGIILDEPAEGRLFSEPISDRELIVVVQPKVDENAQGDKRPQLDAPAGRLRVLDVNTGRAKIDLELATEELKQVNYVRAFQDEGRYYVNLQRAARRSNPKRYNYYATSSFVRTHDLQGDLYAIDKATGRRLWKRHVPQRSFVSTSRFRLPFLVAISNVRDPWNNRKKGLLVEAIDGKTGDTIGYKDNVIADRILQVSYDPDSSIMSLHGFKTRVDLEFDANVQRLAALANSSL